MPNKEVCACLCEACGECRGFVQLTCCPELENRCEDGRCGCHCDPCLDCKCDWHCEVEK